MRSMVKTTSSALNGEPSWYFTPLRSLNSHTFGLPATVDQLVANAGISFMPGSRNTSDS